MKWQSPIAFNLIFILMGVFVYYLFKTRQKKSTLQFSSTMFFRSVPQSLKTRLTWLPKAIGFISLIFIIVALARPQKADTKVNRTVEGIDIMLTMDVSESMLIEDMQPENRITAAKLVVKNFIKNRVSDRVGLVIFSGEAFTRVPLTLDYDILLNSLNEVTTEGLKQGTAIGVAVANSVARLKDSTARSRVLILLTDGENNSGTIDPYTSLDIAKGYGIKIYTIGIGVDGQAQLPVYTTDAFGRRMKHYQPIHSTVNDELLQKLADETGGKYYRATDTAALKKVFDSINKLEKTKIDVNEYVKYTEMYPKYLWFGVMLFLLQFILSQTYLRRTP